MKIKGVFFFFSFIFYFITIGCSDEKCNCPVNNTTVSKDSNLVAYWSYDDGSGLDSSLNGNHGMMMNSVLRVTGKKGKAIQITGTAAVSDAGGHMIIPRIKFEEMNEFSITMWVKEESVAFYHGESYIFWGDLDLGWLGISHAGNNIDSTLYIKFSVGSKNNDQSLKVAFNYSDRGKWVFYCLIYKDGTIYAYRNGILEGTKQQSISIFGKNGAIARQWYVYNGTQSTTRFNGAIDEVRIYKKALSMAEINSLFNL